MVLIHDADLERINGISDATVSGQMISLDISIFSGLCSQLLETLRSDVLMDLLRMSHIEICKVDCSQFSTLKAC